MISRVCVRDSHNLAKLCSASTAPPIHSGVSHNATALQTISYVHRSKGGTKNPVWEVRPENSRGAIPYCRNVEPVFLIQLEQEGQW